ncbi:Shg1p PWA37_003424 [Arxiozyma heterogenica]|uniref:BOD1/SHG1 domain-containing protein n=1 Tax=Arxiozyma heterogenica TaxID=278026 RepID=A0AAN7W441_9SACH|nr:hypothetical protein RI543_001893 [Kazachstania heterogenica]
MLVQNQVDQARELANQFKKQGHFDKLKSEILSRESNIKTKENVTVPGSLETVLKNVTTSIVKDMVSKDEDLIFKNRGSTSALLEAQLLKDDYKKFGEGKNGIELNRYLQSCINDPDLYETIYKELAQLVSKENIIVTNTPNNSQ